MSEQLNKEERIRELEKALQTTRNELSYVSAQLIDEKHLLARMHGLVYNVTQENAQLKTRIEELEAEAAESEARTQIQSRLQWPSMSPVSVPVSPRVHYHHHHTSPRLSPETPEPIAAAAPSDANQRLTNSPRRAEWEEDESEDEIDWEQREREDWFKDHTTVDYRTVTGI
jgi:hypothetical protein